MKIGIFDSGKGGMTILEAIKDRLPNEEYCYIADSKNCPYGEKSDEELQGIVDSISDDLISWGAEIIVVACNTATTRCIDHLRQKYPNVRFVGTEPAVRLAVKAGARKILILATPGTVESERLATLIGENKTNQTIDVLACPGLADAIENNNDVDSVLHNLLDDVDTNYDVVVLGCTHYPLIKDKLMDFFPNARFVDSIDGVADRIEKIVKGE